MTAGPRREGRLVFQLTVRRGVDETRLGPNVARPGAAAGWRCLVRAASQRAGWLAAGWMLASLALPGAGRAEQVVAGGTLTVSDPCAASVELREDPSLAGGAAGGAASRVGVLAEPESAGPTVSGGESVRVGGPCRTRAERLLLRVSPGMAVRLAGRAEWRVESMGGTVEAALEGRGNAEFGAMRVLRLRRTGSGDTHVEAVSERFEAAQSSTGDITVDRLAVAAALHVGDTGTVTVDHAALDSLDVAGIGHGDITLREGRVGRLSTALAGNSSLHGDVVAGTASLVARGDATVEVARVDGTLSRIAQDDATVSVRSTPGAGPAPLTPPLPPAPPYKLHIQVGVGNDVAAVEPGAGRHRNRSASGSLPSALVAFALLGSAAVALRARRRRQRRPESLRVGWSEPRAGAGPRPREAATPWPGEAGVAALEQRLAAVEARLVRVERYVTSGELELQRQFRDLAHERNGPDRQG